MNSYDAPRVTKIGEAHDLILGLKPVGGPLDSDLQVNYAERVDDIDEADEVARVGRYPTYP